MAELECSDAEAAVSGEPHRVDATDEARAAPYAADTAHDANVDTLLEAAKQQYDTQLQVADALDKKLGFALAALVTLMTAGARLSWSLDLVQTILLVCWAASALVAFWCALSGLKTRSYSKLELAQFRSKYTMDPPPTFKDRLLTAYMGHVGDNTALNSRRAALFNRSLNIGFLSFLLFLAANGVQSYAG